MGLGVEWNQKRRKHRKNTQEREKTDGPREERRWKEVKTKIKWSVNKMVGKNEGKNHIERYTVLNITGKDESIKSRINEGMQARKNNYLACLYKTFHG
jgi:hypothetical protein